MRASNAPRPASTSAVSSTVTSCGTTWEQSPASQCVKNSVSRRALSACRPFVARGFARYENAAMAKKTDVRNAVQ